MFSFSVYRHILNKPEMYTSSGKSVIMSMVLFWQNLLIHPRKLALFLNVHVHINVLLHVVLLQDYCD